MNEEILLNEAINKASTGYKSEARQLLRQVLEVNPRSEQAWLWMSALVNTDAQRTDCLKQVLSINPNNMAARKGIAHLHQKQLEKNKKPTVGSAPIHSQETKSHPNLVFGSLQILFWLLFNPQAWRTHIVHIDAHLPLDFTLVELRRRNCKQPLVRRLLIQGYFILPVLTCLLMGIVLYFSGESSKDIMRLLLTGLAGGITFGILLGVDVSLASGIACNVIGIVVNIVLSATYADQYLPIHFIAPAIMLGTVGYVSGTFSSRHPKFSLLKQASSIIVGTLVFLIVFLITLVIGGGITLAILAISQVIYNTKLAPFEIQSIFDIVVQEIENDSDIFVMTLVATIIGITIGLATGLRNALVGYKLRRGILLGLVLGAILNIAIGFGFHLTSIVLNESVILIIYAIMFGAITAACFVLPYVIVRQVAGAWPGALTGALVSWVVWIWPNNFETVSRSDVFLGLLSMLFCLTFGIWQFPIRSIFLSIQKHLGPTILFIRKLKYIDVIFKFFINWTLDKK